MAGDWLKIDHDLPEKPEVAAISAELSMDPDMVVGKLIKAWRWFDRHTENGCAVRATKVFLDAQVGSQGFADALENVGWLTITERGLRLPKFDRHNAKSAKRRALAKNRMRCARSATKASPEKRREEKRRVRKKSKPKERGTNGQATDRDGRPLVKF